MTGKDIIKSAISGDKDSFVELLMDNYEHLYRTAYEKLEDEYLVMNALNETAYRTFKHRRKLKLKRKNIKEWFTEILVDICGELLEEERYHVREL